MEPRGADGGGPWLVMLLSLVVDTCACLDAVSLATDHSHPSGPHHEQRVWRLPTCRWYIYIQYIYIHIARRCSLLTAHLRIPISHLHDCCWWASSTAKFDWKNGLPNAAIIDWPVIFKKKNFLGVVSLHCDWKQINQIIQKKSFWTQCNALENALFYKCF